MASRDLIKEMRRRPARRHRLLHNGTSSSHRAAGHLDRRWTGLRSDAGWIHHPQKPTRKNPQTVRPISSVWVTPETVKAAAALHAPE